MKSLPTGRNIVVSRVRVNTEDALAASLDLNGVGLSDPEDELYPLMMRVAGSGAGKAETAAMFRELADR